MVSRRRNGLSSFIALIIIFSPGVRGNTSETVAVSGGMSPDNDGQFSSFELPVLTQSGHVGFIATLSGTANTRGVYTESTPPPFSPFLPNFGAPKVLDVNFRSNEASLDGDGNYAEFQQLLFAAQQGTQSNASDYLAIKTTFSNSSSTSGMLVNLGSRAADRCSSCRIL